MNNQKNLYLRAALACLSATGLSYANPSQKTTMVGQNVAGGATPFLEFDIKTANEDLNAYRTETTEYLAPCVNQLKYMSDENMEKKFGTKDRKEAEQLAAKQDANRGSSIRYVFPKSLWSPLVDLVRETSGNEEAERVDQLFNDIHYTDFGDEKAYSTFCLTSGFLGTEKMLLDAEKKDGIKVQLHSLDNPSLLLEGPTREQAKLSIFKDVLSKKALAVANADPKEIQKNLCRIKKEALPTAFTKHPEVFKHFTSSGLGYNFLYAAQQATLIHMVATNERTLEEFNTYKDMWNKSEGDLERKMNGLLNPVLAKNPTVYCTQEASPEYLEKVTRSDRFLPIDKQPTGDGSHIFLAKKNFADYKVIPLCNYKKYTAANVVLVEATRHNQNASAPIELYCSFHASSRNAQDRLDIMQALAEKVNDLHQKTGRAIVLRVQGDANTDSADKVKAFLKDCSELGFVEGCQALNQKPVATVAKMRIFSSQKEKEFKPDRNRKDFAFYLAVGLDVQQKTQFVTVKTGFEPYDATRNLPDSSCPADHYPIDVECEDIF